MEDIITIFSEEFKSRAYEIISILERRELEKAELNELYRHFHTLKGSSQMVGLENFGKLFHRVETVFKSITFSSGKVDMEKLKRIKNMMIYLLDLNIANDLNTSKLEKLIDYIEKRRDTLDLEATKSIDIKMEDIRKTLIFAMDTLSKALSTLKDLIKDLKDGKRSKMEDVMMMIEETLKFMEDSMRIMEYTKLDDFMISLKRLIDDMARREGKEVELTVDMSQIFVERKTFSAIYEPLIHIVKNSVKHGIEPPEEREKLGKPRKGRIRIKVEPIDKGINIMVEDDGCGIDIENLKNKAKEIGLDYEDPTELVFIPGLSTLESEDIDGGRGVGMFAVKQALQKLHGTIRVETEKNKGTKIMLFVPYSTMSEYLLVLKREKLIFALPIDKVKKVIPISDLEKEEKIFKPSEAFDLNYNAEPRYLIILKGKAIMADEIIGVERYIVKSSELKDVYPNVIGWIIRERKPVPVLDIT